MPQESLTKSLAAHVASRETHHKDRILRLPEVSYMTGLSRSTIYRREREGAFPRRLRLSPRAIGYRESEVLHFIDTRMTVGEVQA